MRDPAKGSASKRTGAPEPEPSRLAAAWGFTLFCAVTGVIAVGAGAALALLVPGPEARLLVWSAVTLVIAAGAGLWWGYTPVTTRLRTLDRILTAGRTQGRPQH